MTMDTKNVREVRPHDHGHENVREVRPHDHGHEKCDPGMWKPQPRDVESTSGGIVVRGTVD